MCDIQVKKKKGENMDHSCHEEDFRLNQLQTIRQSKSLDLTPLGNLPHCEETCTDTPCVHATVYFTYIFFKPISQKSLSNLRHSCQIPVNFFNLSGLGGSCATLLSRFSIFHLSSAYPFHFIPPRPNPYTPIMLKGQM